MGLEEQKLSRMDQGSMRILSRHCLCDLMAILANNAELEIMRQ